jgi:hypothetical protein
MGTGSFSGVKRPGHGVDHPPSSRAGVKERVQLYLCFPSRPQRPVLRGNLTLPLPLLLPIGRGEKFIQSFGRGKLGREGYHFPSPRVYKEIILKGIIIKWDWS